MIQPQGAFKKKRCLQRKRTLFWGRTVIKAGCLLTQSDKEWLFDSLLIIMIVMLSA